MNVRVTQTVSLEDVPEYASKMVKEAKQLLIEELFSLDLVKNSIPGLMTMNQDLTDVTSELSKIRLALSKADAKLEDCMGTIQGYGDVIDSLLEKDAKEPEVSEDNVSFAIDEEEENDRQID